MRSRSDAVRPRLASSMCSMFTSHSTASSTNLRTSVGAAMGTMNDEHTMTAAQINASERDAELTEVGGRLPVPAIRVAHELQAQEWETK